MKSKLEKVAIKMAKQDYPGYKILTVNDNFTTIDITLMKDRSTTVMLRFSESEVYKGAVVYKVLK